MTKKVKKATRSAKDKHKVFSAVRMPLKAKRTANRANRSTSKTMMMTTMMMTTMMMTISAVIMTLAIINISLTRS